MSPNDININQTTAVKCACGCNVFEEKYIIRTLSKVLAASPQDLVIPIQVWRCVKCKEILKKFLPSGIGTPEEIIGKCEQNQKFDSRNVMISETIVNPSKTVKVYMSTLRELLQDIADVDENIDSSTISAIKNIRRIAGLIVAKSEIGGE